MLQLMPDASYSFQMRIGHSATKGLLIALTVALIPISGVSTLAAGPQTPSCGNYKVTKNEVIAGVKFPKGTYQINAFGISCSKVMGSKGLFAQFLKLKDKDPLPKPWRYLSDAIGAPKFSSGPGVGFRVQIIGTKPAPTPTRTQITSPNKSLELDIYSEVTDPSKVIAPSRESTIRTNDGRLRSYLLFVPSTINQMKPAPLVIALHGGLGSAAQFEGNSGLSEFAESNGFYVAYPNGIGAIENRVSPQTWNAGDCCVPAANNNVDDVSYIKSLVKQLKSSYSIDSNRVFAIGHSNGGMLAYKLACELSDEITGIGVQSASLGMNLCQPTHPVSVVHIHGTSDTNFPIDGGLGSGIAGVPFRSARFAVDTLATSNKCEASPETSKMKENSDLVIYSWKKCASPAGVRYLIVNGASHAWMGHPAQSNLANSYVGSPYEKLDSTRALLSFLLLHPRS
jgi:polyhydroxybutyrate depolymerase